MKTSVYVIPILTLYFCFLCSCSDELTHKKAASLIKSYHNYPLVEGGETYLPMNIPFIEQDDKYLKLIEGGMFQLTYKTQGNRAIPQLIITPQGENCVLARRGTSVMLPTAIWEFDKVLNIHVDPNTNTAEVNYAVKRMKVTALGKYKNLKNGEIMEYSINFKKFQKGWNVSDPKTGMKNVDEVDCL